jgi:excisionase family DNA binding protein
MTTATATAADGPGPRMLLSVAEVAAELGCGRDTVYGLLASGALPSVTVGGRLRRICRRDLLAYIDRLTVTRPSKVGHAA